MNRLTVGELLQDDRGLLGLTHITGQSGFTNDIGFLKVRRYMENETFWDNLDPKTILILSPSNLAALDAASSSIKEKIFDVITSASIPCIVLSQSQTLPDLLIHLSSVCHIPLLASIYDEFLLESRLQRILAEMMDDVIVMHGALVNVNSVGVVIAGESGTGKTKCAIRLAEKGHHWIADDIIQIKKKGRDVLYGRSHERVRDFFEIKDVGIFNVRDFLKEGVINEETVVNIMVKFEKLDDGWEMQGKETFDGVYNIMGVKLPCMNFPTDLSEERSARYIDFVTKKYSYGGRI